MININSTQRVFVFAVLSALLLPIHAFAQTAGFSLGDDVEIACRQCPGAVSAGDGWVKGQVVFSVQQNRILRVRFADGIDGVITVQNTPQSIRVPRARLKKTADAEMRNAFIRDAYDLYYESIRSMMMVHDMNMVDGSSKSGPPVDPKKWDKVVSDLAALDNLCKTKYAGMVDSEADANSKRKELRKLPATWCVIAANRVEYEKRGRAMAMRSRFSRLTVVDDMNAAMTNRDNRTPDEVQAVMYNRAAWKAKQVADIQPHFAALKTEVPLDLYDEAFAKADELKAVIEKGAPNRSWTPPPYKDAAVESFINTKFTGAPEFKGAKVMKTGLDYTTWKKRESLSLVGSDSKYKYYKVEHNSYKRGWALVKMPGQPFCQAREWIVGKGAKGIVLVSLGGSGIYMKCQ